MITSVTKIELVENHPAPPHVRVTLKTTEVYQDPGTGVDRDTLMTFVPRFHEDSKDLLVGAQGPIFATDLTGLAQNSPKDLNGQNLMERYGMDISIAWLNLLIESREGLIESQQRLGANDSPQVIARLREDIERLKSLRNERPMMKI